MARPLAALVALGALIAAPVTPVPKEADKLPLTATYWFAPGVGQVKMVARSGVGKEEGAVVLKSFTLGK